MAKERTTSAVAAEPKKGRYRVAVRGYPIVGYPDGDKVLSRLPVELHYRQRKADEFGELIDGWHTAESLREKFGVEKIPDDWQRRRRVRTDLSPVLFVAAIVAADTEFEARAVFCDLYGLRDTDGGNWDVTHAPEGSPLGPCDPFKDRGIKGLLKSA